MAPKQSLAKYQYVVTPSGPKILPVDEPSCKDEESPADYNVGGYLPVKLNDTFKNGRYKVIRKLGWGHFSTVWLVKDTQLHRHSALKVVKSAGRYAETARDEITLLSQVAAASPYHPGRQHVVSFLDSFCHQGPEASHICIVFEPLGENLLALIERNKKRGVPRAHVKVIARQALLALQYLHDECDLVHTDIKPENILISIPDIEAHISTELSQSSSPTSRRVGVPLPANIKSAVGRQRSIRKSVQIFDSQPLASPSRSAGPLSLGMSFGPPFGGGGSGYNSTNGSYTASSPLACKPSIENKATTPGSSVPKAPSGLSATAPSKGFTAFEAIPKQKQATNSAVLLSVKASPILNSPSTSSSSSSIASTTADATSASTVSTPPTSLPNSFGSASMGLLMMKDRINAGQVSPVQESDREDLEGLPVPTKTGSPSRTEGGLSSWKTSFGSWKDKVSFSLSSSSKSSNLNDRLSNAAAVPSPTVSTSWKDPGVSAPAPAVVVSTSVRADGQEERGNCFTVPSPSRGTPSASLTKSGSSSNTMTIAHPSPTGTIHGSPGVPSTSSSTSVFTSLRNSPEQGTSPSPLTNEPKQASLIGITATKPMVHKPSNGPSLLSQTAPHRMNVPVTLALPSPSIDKGSIAALPRTSSSTKSKTSPPPPISTHKPDYAPLVASPSCPPPTPCSSASLSTQMPSPPSNTTAPPVMRVLPRIETGAQPVDIPLPSSATHAPPAPMLSIKIADLGNATPSKKHYTEDIQTRQYRAPEAILGRKDWDARADIWSIACVIFELLTAEYLFDPQGQGELFSKDDDHMAQIIELMGDFEYDVKMGGRFSKDLFDHTGALRYIRNLKHWPLKRVMMEKYLYSEADAKAFCSFLDPMLAVDFRKRANARDMIDHDWLEVVEGDDVAGSW